MKNEIIVKAKLLPNGQIEISRPNRVMAKQWPNAVVKAILQYAGQSYFTAELIGNTYHINERVPDCTW